MRAAELTERGGGGGGSGGGGGGSGGNHWHNSDGDSAGDGALPFGAVLTVAGLDAMEGWNGRRKPQPAVKRQASPLMAALSAVAVASAAAAAQPVSCSSGADECAAQSETGDSSSAAPAPSSQELSSGGPSGGSSSSPAAAEDGGSGSADTEASAPPKRIVMLVEPSPFTYCSGYQTRFRATIREMVAEGCQVLVVTPGKHALPAVLSLPVLCFAGHDFWHLTITKHSAAVGRYHCFRLRLCSCNWPCNLVAFLLNSSTPACEPIPAGRGAAGLLPGGQEQPAEFEGARVVEAGSFPCPGYRWVASSQLGGEDSLPSCPCYACT